MPRKVSLKGFLRQEVLSKRPKALIPYYNDHKASHKPGLKLKSEPVVTDRPFPSRPASREPGLKLKHEPVATDEPLPPESATFLSDNGEGDVQPAQDVDSLFGEPICTKEEILQQKLEELLARDLKQSRPAKQQQSGNQELDKLKKELNDLVIWEMEATGEQIHMIRHRKAELISVIGKLEEKIKSNKVKSCKVKSNEEAMLPEPISPPEKKHLQMVQQRVAKGLLGLEGKRKRGDEDEDAPYELDGEDRLRTGIKRKELRITGHWYSRVHDYFPEPEKGVPGRGVLEDLTPEERKEYRRELAEYAEILAKTAKKTNEAERKAGKGVW